ncbi:MAG TPA: crotonyl-CoA carboxylase/reductase [Acidimicrobiales bacterium]
MGIERIRAAILGGASGDELAALPLPDTVRGAIVRERDADMFAGLSTADKDPRRSLRVEEFPLPELAPDEAYVAVMASSINFNTVWSSIFEPVPTFTFLKRYGRESRWGKRHDQPWHVLGSDAAGVVLRTGPAVRRFKPGDEVTIHANVVDDQEPSAHDDSMLAANQRAWGFETNFGGLAEICVVKANQLMPKPAHLTWEEAAVNTLTAATSYRMLISKNGAGLQQGQVVLIWGASGGIGSYAVQHVLNGGGVPVAVVSSERKAELVRAMGVQHVINRRAEGFRFWNDDGEQDPNEWKRFGRCIRNLVGDDPDIVFEHPGRETLGASVFVTKRGGLVVTCAATTGYKLEFDARYLWMNLKTIKGCHFANYREADEANRLACEGKIYPTLSRVFPLSQVADATWEVHQNRHEGKLGVLVLAPDEGLGVRDPIKRAKHLDQIMLFRRHVGSPIATIDLRERVPQ